MRCSRCGAALAAEAGACEACGSVVPRLEGAALAPGTMIAGKYELGAEIGAGGMGRVYRAVQHPLGTAVCVKTLHMGAAADPQFEARFLREATTTAALRHPNIVTVLDFGSHVDGSLYLVMEYIEGTSLAAIAKSRRTMSAARAVAILGQVCDALSAAHDRGVVHRDLKPANIMVHDLAEKRDFVKVLDFGSALILAGAERESERLTRVGTVIGTPAYMAPEHILGRPVDGRVDLYAVGVLLYSLLCGSAPFRGNVQTVFAQQVSVQPEPPSRRNPRADVTPQMESVVLRALEKDPARRHPSALALKVAMEAALAGVGESDHEVDLSAGPGPLPSVAPEERSVAVLAVRTAGPVAGGALEEIAGLARSAGALAELRDHGLSIVFGLDGQEAEPARRALELAFELAGRQSRRPLRLGLHDALASCRGEVRETRFGFELFGRGAGIAESLAETAAPGQVLVSGPLARLAPSRLRLSPVLPPSDIDEPVFALVDPASADLERKRLPFVGREADRRALVELAVEASAGRVCLLVGGEGSGKSRLLEEVSSQAGRLETLWCVVPTSTQAEVGPSHPVSLVAALGWSAADPAASTTERYVVGLMLGRQDRSHDGLSGERRQRRLVSAAIEGLGRRLKHGPVVLALDELHRADDLTWALARRLCQGAAVLGVSVVLCVREPGQVPFPLPSDAARLDFGPLDDDELQTLARGALEADPPTAALVAAASRGLPLLASEVVAAVGRGEGSLLATVSGLEPLEAVVGLVSARIDAVSPRALELLSAAAVLGLAPPEAELLEVVGQSEDNDLALLELHSDGLLLSEPGGRLRFPFDRVRAAALEAIPRSEVRRLRSAAARTVRHFDWSEARRFEIGEHLLAAGDLTGAFGELRRAAALARSEGEQTRAIDCLRSCLRASAELGPARIEDQLSTARDLGEALVERGDLEGAREVLDGALGLAREALRTSTARGLVRAGAEMLRLHALVALRTGDLDRAASEIRTALAFSERQELGVLAAEGQAVLAELCERRGDERSEREALERGLELLADEPAPEARPVRVRLLNRLGALEVRRDPARAVELLSRALEIAEGAGDQFQAAALLGNLGGAHARLQDTASAIHFTERALRASEALGDQIGICRQCFNLAVLRLAAGQAHSAHKLLRASHEAARCGGWTDGLRMSAGALRKLGLEA